MINRSSAFSISGIDHCPNLSIVAISSANMETPSSLLASNQAIFFAFSVSTPGGKPKPNNAFAAVETISLYEIG